MESYWVVGPLVLVSLAAAALWFFCYTGPGEQPDYDKICGWRERKAEATSYSDMQDYRDSIEEEYEKGNRKGETPYRQLLRWWKRS